MRRAEDVRLLIEPEPHADQTVERGGCIDEGPERLVALTVAPESSRANARPDDRRHVAAMKAGHMVVVAVRFFEGRLDTGTALQSRRRDHENLAPPLVM